MLMHDCEETSSRSVWILQDNIKVENEEWENRAIFQQWFAPLGHAVQQGMGHQLKHMLLSCEFAGDKCNRLVPLGAPFTNMV